MAKRRKKRKATRKKKRSTKKRKATRKKKRTTRKSTRKRTTRKKKRTSRKKATKKRKKRRPNAAFMAPLRPSAALAKVVGSKPLPRTQAVKKLWAYIKRKKLQDKKNRRMIIVDQNLRPIFGKSKINMFQMMKHLKKHLK